MLITLYGTPRTKKNSPVLIGGSRPRLLPSKAYREYAAVCKRIIASEYLGQMTHPVNMQCVYYMPTRRAVDLNNLLEATTDILVEAGVLKDDNCLCVPSHDGSRVRYDKDNPRVEITLTESKEALPWQSAVGTARLDRAGERTEG